ncbi:UV-endonuclease UvdE [Polychaeton citri CBS 116435]|uniref:UV-endonuclease UvdE n=1 Tax=Polychaeton citri CBS 116435 TaxID=1314669 RepID=A0A9P4QBF3_9PEZI|nr:UV-endonuclease UvdE [Polychaeton citri CBS 116435]
MPAMKRKASTQATAAGNHAAPAPPALKRRASSRRNLNAVTNPEVNSEILDAPNATRASPDGSPMRDLGGVGNAAVNGIKEESPLSDAPETVVEPTMPVAAKGRGRKGKGVKSESGKKGVEETEESKAKATVKAEEGTSAAATPKPASGTKAKGGDTDYDPEAAEDEDADPEEVKQALSRPPPVNSDYLPLPWKGRLGYACLNTYLRNSNPPVFSSRTCRIQSILEHRHPLRNPEEPEHATKNRPDRSKPADVGLGMQYLEAICLANVQDIKKMIRWNDRYGIRFMRLSSEIFPFASHPEYGYKLAPFATDALADAGKVIAQFGHRVTTHPGQFTQLGSPRKQVIDNAIRDLAYHDEMLTLLRLPEQLDKDAVMIIHMGGVFDDKAATIQRFKDEYVKLPQSVKNRLVLENDDVSYSVHDLLPVCEELNIPFVLDYHHHNIIFDADKIREGTRDIMDLYPRILATWERKGITPKMHYSEPTPSAITGRQRRKHNPRVATLPPCPPTMDLMIEAKDKEQAVFELMRTFKLPKFDTFNDVIPYVRDDDNKVALQLLNRKKKPADAPDPSNLVPDEEVGMGGADGRVYWPPGMEDYLRPKKREVKPKEAKAPKSKETAKQEAAKAYAERQAQIKEEEAENESESDPNETPATKKAKAAMKKKDRAVKIKAEAKKDAYEAAQAASEVAVAATAPAEAEPKGRKQTASEEPIVPTPSPSASELDDVVMKDEDGDESEDIKAPVAAVGRGTRKSARGGGGRKRVSYAEDDEDDALVE